MADSCSKTGPVASVLIFGDVLGKFSALSRIATRLNNEKGPFEGIYCVGDFFSDSSPEWELLKSGKIEIPIPCYILGPSKKKHLSYYSHDGNGQLAPSVIYLGKRGINTTASGLKVAYLSGVESSESCEYAYNAKDAYDMQQIFQKMSLMAVDLLLTSMWPMLITRHLPPSANPLTVTGSELVSFIAKCLKPCYHVSGLKDMFFERLPYRNTRRFADEISHPTRFIGLAKLGNPEKKRYVYGITHTPIHKASKDFLKKFTLQNVSTQSPYDNLAFDIEGAGKQNIIGNVNTSTIHTSGSFGAKKNEEKQIKPMNKKGPRSLNCWFCLASDVDEHLIISYGYDCYLALAKGWITEDHFIIVPNSHVKCSAQLSNNVLEEVEHYKSSLKNYFHQKNKVFVCFERSFKSPHMQLQVIAVPESAKAQLIKGFLKEASAINIDLEEVPPYSVTQQLVGQNYSYFYVEIEDSRGHCKKFIHLLKNDFPLNFARNILASVLELPDRGNWKECLLSDGEELHVSRKVKRQLEQYIPYGKGSGKSLS